MLDRTVGSLAEGIASSMGLELVEVKVKKLNDQHLVQVFITKKDGVTIQECSKLSRELDGLMEAEGLFGGSYSLEVSSPGLDRPLTTDKDFLRNIGRKVKVKKSDPESSKMKVVSGVVLDVVGGVVELDVEGQHVLVPLQSIKEAKLIIQV